MAGLTFFLSQIRSIFQTFSEASGANIAAEFMGISRALQALTGNGERATRIMEQFKRLGAQSAFDTSDVAATGARMLGAGVSESSLIPELSALLDLASHGMGLSRQDFPEFMRNLLQIRGRGTGRADLADINQLKDRVPQIGSFLAAGMGGGMSREDALKRAQAMTGRQLYETIIRGSQAMARGAAAAKALQDPVAALGNLFEQLRMVMEPTGKILLRIAMPVLFLAGKLVDLLRWINETSKGVAGLVGLLAGGLWFATRTATVALLDFVKAMTATAVAARAGAVGVGTAGAAAAGGAAAGGILGWAARALPALLKGGVIASIIAIMGGLIGGALRGDGANQRRNAAANIAEWGLGGAGGGALIGALFGGIGAVPGALIGLIGGVLVAALGNLFGGWDKPSSPEAKQLQEQKKTNQLLENLNATVRGGGPRTAAAASNFVTELQLAKFLSL
jgi:hypothetical protein